MAFKRSNLAPNQKSESSIKIEETKLVFFPPMTENCLSHELTLLIVMKESPLSKSSRSEEIGLCDRSKRGRELRLAVALPHRCTDSTLNL